MPKVYWYHLQNDLTQDCNDNNIEFWKAIGKLGVK